MSVRKTVDIDDDLRAKIDQLRKEHGLSTKQIVNDAMRLGLREIAEKERQQAKARSVD